MIDGGNTHNFACMKLKFPSFLLALASALTFITTTAFAADSALNKSNPLTVSGTESLDSQLSRIMLPIVELKDAPLSDVLSYLTMQTAKASDGKVRLHFNSKLPKDYPPIITLHLVDVSVMQTLDYIGKLTNVDFTVQQNEIVVTQKTLESEAAKRKIEEGKNLEGAELKVKLRKLILPKVELSDATIVQACSYLRKITSANVVLEVPKGTRLTDQKITLHLTNVSAVEAFQTVAQQTNCEIHYVGNYIYILQSSSGSAIMPVSKSTPSTIAH